MKTLILLMQLFGNNGMQVNIQQLEDTTPILGCDYHYTGGMEIVSCLRGKKAILYLGTTPEFWDIQEAATLIAISKKIPN
jgi:hypothetical protein